MIRLVCLLVLVSCVSLSSALNCTENQDCTTTILIPSATTQYVQCVRGQCACEGRGNCFTYDPSASASVNSCVLDSQCYRYTTLGACESTARNWLTALLLQVFVGGVGAANFYIGRSELGGGQIFLFLVVLIFPFFLCCAGCVSGTAFSCGEDNACGAVLGCCVVILIVLLCLIVVVAALMMSTWWLADVIIFATNQRTDLNGCTLDQPF